MYHDLSEKAFAIAVIIVGIALAINILSGTIIDIMLIQKFFNG
jgi:hypothetical protein